MRKALIQLTDGLSGSVTNIIVVPEGWPHVDDAWTVPVGMAVIDPFDDTQPGDYWDAVKRQFVKPKPPQEEQP